MVEYTRTSNGRFYKVTKAGKKTRIGREAYLKAISNRKKKRTSSRKKSRTCEDKLQNQIRTNMKEFKNGKFQTRSQALAVAYSQVSRSSDQCEKKYGR